MVVGVTEAVFSLSLLQLLSDARISITNLGAILLLSPLHLSYSFSNVIRSYKVPYISYTGTSRLPSVFRLPGEVWSSFERYYSLRSGMELISRKDIDHDHEVRL